MKRLYIDMDGTLCRFYEQAFCVEKCRESGFFLGLRPYDNLVKAVQILRETVLDTKENFCVYILSAVYDDKARGEKQKWLKRIIGDDIPALFVKVDANKAETVSSMFEGTGLTKDDYLLDDYSKNLIEWSAANGTAIKFRNEVNGRGWNGYNFSGHTVYYDQNPGELAHDILCIMELIDGEKASPDAPVSEEIMRKEIDRILSNEPVWRKVGNEWHTELYADYRDELCFADLHEIFSSSDPHIKFYELMEKWYGNADYEARDYISSVVRKKLGEIGGVFAVDEDGFFIDDETEELYQDLFDSGIFCCDLPYKHFYKQRVQLDIMIDTGDGNRDYVENAVYPHWDGTRGETISDTASIVWLAETQGFSKMELQTALNNYRDGLDKTGFLGTLGQELINMPSHMAVLTFLVETTLEKALKIADCMVPDCLKTENPAIKIGKGTMAGLYDPWGGGGSVFEIELEKDVLIPLRIIRSALPDGCDGICSIAEIYAMCASAWRDTLIAITVQADAA